MSETQHEDEQGGEFYNVQLPCWRFSMWDVAGIAAAGVGGLFSVVGQAGNLLAREFSAAANYSRQNYDLREAQRLHEEGQKRLAAELERTVGFGYLPAGEETP